MTLSEAIHARCQSIGLMPHHLAEMLHLSPQQLSEYERDGFPPELLPKLARALHWPVEHVRELAKE